MKLSHFVKRVEKSSEYKKFRNKNPHAYLCAGFFVIDYELGKNQEQIDYFLNDNKVATFMLEKPVKMKISQAALTKKAGELKGDTRLDLEQLKGIIHDEMENQTITEEIKKIIAVIQVIDGKKTWILNCVLSGLNLLKVNIDDKTGNILRFEKANLMDFIRRM